MVQVALGVLVAFLADHVVDQADHEVTFQVVHVVLGLVHVALVLPYLGVVACHHLAYHHHEDHAFQAEGHNLDRMAAYQKADHEDLRVLVGDLAFQVVEGPSYQEVVGLSSFLEVDLVVHEIVGEGQEEGHVQSEVVVQEDQAWKKREESLRRNIHY